VIEETFMVSSA